MLLLFLFPLITQKRINSTGILCITDFLGDLKLIRAPREVCWPSTPMLDGFVEIYDWDIVTLDNSCTRVQLQLQLNLCTGFLPCALRIVSYGKGKMLLSGEGSLSCFGTLGCSSISIESMALGCGGTEIQNPALQIQGSVLTVFNVTFSNCSSNAYGTFIQAYQAAVVTISECRFLSAVSSGYAGVVSALGSKLSIQNSFFSECFAGVGGGAVWASTFQLFGSKEQFNASLFVDSTVFDTCTTDGSGGAILVTDSTLVRDEIYAFVRSTTFAGCNSSNDGGAMSCTGNSVACYLMNSTFTDCQSKTSGGAISQTSAANMTMMNMSFIKNRALGNGGGAIYVLDAYLSLAHVISRNNTAKYGGGGILYHDGISGVHIALDSLLSHQDEVVIFSTDFNQSLYILVKEKIVSMMIRAQNLGLDSGMCLLDDGNDAMYGRCIASSYARLEVQGLPTNVDPVFPGIQFSVTLQKKDFYNQTIISDSSSLIQTLTSIGVSRDDDPSVSISGSVIAALLYGRAEFVILLNPTFTYISFDESITAMKRRPYIYFKGIDSLATSGTMETVPEEVHISNGSSICPKGYILVLDRQIHGSCSECVAGTYSVDPLAGTSSVQPSCFNCPQSATCAGGDSVQFPHSSGVWVVFSGFYKLVSCPVGYQLINTNELGKFSIDVQTCRECSTDQYILDSNSSNFTCQACPKGRAFSCFALLVLKCSFDDRFFRCRL